jgi:DNA-binding SARP family transcriptional activator
MAQLRISLIGPFQVVQDEQPVVHFDTNKVRALLAYLATENDRPHLRETLAGLLWPDFTNTSAATNLRSSIAKLRQAIGDHQASPPFLTITRETIQLNPTGSIWVDVGEFEAAIRSQRAGIGDQRSGISDQQSGTGNQQSAINNQKSTIRNLQSAISLYRGPFLEGFFCDSPVFEE